MLRLGTSCKGYLLTASDGEIGHVHDLLFDDSNWRVRWLVVDTGSWLPGRKVLLHPFAMAQADKARRTAGVDLTLAQVEASSGIVTDEPVSRQMEHGLHAYYGWNAVSGMGHFSTNAIATPLSPPPLVGVSTVLEAPADRAGATVRDPHLRSLAEVTGYHIDATDGEIGHLTDIMLDDASWTIKYLVIATRNWWPGVQVLVSPAAVTHIRWEDRRVVVGIAREKIKCSPIWDPAIAIDRAYTDQVDKHYGWHPHARQAHRPAL
jgi:hypothetical protein